MTFDFPKGGHHPKKAGPSKSEGQQDDFFEADLDTAGNHPKKDGDKLPDQQDDFFEADLDKAGEQAKKEGVNEG